MEAIEFAARVRDGAIEVPEAYRDRLPERVRVIVLCDAEAEPDAIAALLAHPVPVAEFRPLSRAEAYADRIP